MQVQVLLQYGADVAMPGRDGLTPVMLAEVPAV